MNELIITLSTGFKLTFLIHNTPIAKRWVDALQEAQEFPYPIDDPKRFYGFNSRYDEQAYALEKINTTIDTINNHEEIINRKVMHVDDQDTLNYLHHIFEVYHGMLDGQTHPYYVSAPAEVQKALGDLNLNVHRCECAYRGNDPRVVLTYYGLPKTRKFVQSDFNLITNCYRFGTVYLNYVEIGKTLEDLFVDGDIYIAEEAFKPLDNFSADFTVKFFNADMRAAQCRRLDVFDYALEHSTFVGAHGYQHNDSRLAPGLIPVANLTTHKSELEILEQIKLSQEVINVTLI